MFLTGYGYMAAWPHEATRALFARRVVDEPVLPCRTRPGRAVALEDRCLEAASDSRPRARSSPPALLTLSHAAANPPILRSSVPEELSLRRSLVPWIVSAIRHR